MVTAVDQGSQLLLLQPGVRPEALTVHADGDDYTDLVMAPTGRALWCVRRRWTASGAEHAIVGVPLGPGERGQSRDVLVSKGWCLSTPRPSPDGRLLAWIAWESPAMPWDGAELRVGRLTPDGVADQQTLLGGPVEAVFQPEWASADSLYVASDRSRWYNLYEVFLDGTRRPLYQAPEEFGWSLSGGRATYGMVFREQLAVLHGRGDWRLDRLDPADGTLYPLGLPFTGWQPSLRTGGSHIAGVASSSTQPAAVVLVDVATGRHQLLRGSAPDITREFLPSGTAETFHGRDGHDVHAVVYPPHHPQLRASSGEVVPYLLFLPHGPGEQAEPGRELIRAFFTSRGVGVAEVYPRGSSGYGRAYREEVYGRWGVADVEDCSVVVRGLVREWHADPARIAVRGSGAGGTTALAVLINTDACAAATVYAAITDVERLACESVDRTAPYLAEIAADSTLLRTSSWLGRIGRPLLLIHGLRDTVVPVSQSTLARAVLWRHHRPNEFLVFADEGHELGQTDAVSRALAAELAFYGRVMGFEHPDAKPISMPRQLSRLR